MTKAITFISAMLVGATGAAAQPPLVVTGEPLPFRVVSYADLNLGSQAGQERLVHRIRAAASDLCIENSREEIKFSTARRACYRTALNSGIRQMNSAVAASESGTTLAAATLTISGK